MSKSDSESESSSDSESSSASESENGASRSSAGLMKPRRQRRGLKRRRGQSRAE